MKRIFFITRSYGAGSTGGIIIRAGMVRNLEKLGYEVIVVTPNYNTRKIIREKNIVYIPMVTKRIFTSPLERIGLLEDYLDLWIKDVYQYLMSIVKSQDYIFATSGGELGCIKIAGLLKDSIKCKVIANLHDPIDYSYVNGMKIDKLFHVDRERSIEKHLSKMDLIITSSKIHQNALINKYPQLKIKIVNNYFGFVENYSNFRSEKHNGVRIGYGGALGWAQNPKLLVKAIRDIPNVELYIVGNHSKPFRTRSYGKNYKLVQQMNHSDYLKYAQTNFDIGFVSLTREYFGACVPSKIYEFINLAIPILGSLPNGDAMDIINENKFGIACHFRDTEGLHEAAVKLSDSEFREEIRLNMIKNKCEWAMEKRIKEIHQYFQKMQ